MAFILRNEKASWCIACNQDIDGTLWIGKGYEVSLLSQFGVDVALAVARALGLYRGQRNGRFWVDVNTRRLVMQVGEANDNEQLEAGY
jgi:hypothetical protein